MWHDDTAAHSHWYSPSHTCKPCSVTLRLFRYGQYTLNRLDATIGSRRRHIAISINQPRGPRSHSRTSPSTRLGQRAAPSRARLCHLCYHSRHHHWAERPPAAGARMPWLEALLLCADSSTCPKIDPFPGCLPLHPLAWLRCGSSATLIDGRALDSSR